MKLNVQPGTAKNGQDPTNRRNNFFVSSQKNELRLTSARDKLEIACLDTHIPGWIRKHLTFYRIHCAYFLFLTIVGTLALYLEHRSDTGETRFSIVDSIFNIVSAVTVTGLTTVRIADFSYFDKFLLVILTTLGSPVFTSLLPLYVRRFYFQRHHRKYVEGIKDISTHGTTLEIPKFPSAKPGGEDHMGSNLNQPTGGRRPLFFGSPDHSMDNGRSNSGHGELASMETRRFSLTVEIVKALNKPIGKSKNSVFNGPTDSQVLDWEEPKSADYDIGLNPHEGSPPAPISVMKTNEHQALVALTWLVTTYMVINLLTSFALSLLILYVSPHAMQLLKERNLNNVFFSFFTSVASFTNSGIPANDDNLVPFQSQEVLLLLCTFVSLLGNVLYPPCIRLIIWILRFFAEEPRKPIYSYLLDHPRRCFTHLFPYKQTIWLCVTVIGFTAIQVIFFCILDWHSDALAGLNAVSKVVDGVYQSVSVRSAGGNAVVTSELAPSMLVLYLFMMTIASYPITLLRQNSTEYEHGDLGIYDKRWEQELTDNSLAFQSRKLLAKDSAFQCVMLFLICFSESRKIEKDPLNFSIFKIIFEIVSAYGGVGMSLGYSCSLRIPIDNQDPGPCTDVPYSFSGKWSPWGRLILAIVMFMGRHRGLPDEIDSAIKLPSFSDVSMSASSLSTARRSPAATEASMVGKQAALQEVDFAGRAAPHADAS